MKWLRARWARLDEESKAGAYLIAALLAVAALALMTPGCSALRGVTITVGTPQTPPTPPPTVPPPAPAPATWLVDAVACAKALAEPYACAQPVAGATIQMHGPAGYITKTADGAGYAVFELPAPFPDSDVNITATGYVPIAGQHIDVLSSHDSPRHNIVLLTADVPPLPAPPTRDEILNLHLTFQGLYCDTQQFGRLPWFEAALPWLTPADRARCYAAKHASTAWGGGDTHALINLPSGPPLYDEPGQPYSADRFPALDWTAGGTHVDERLADLIAEVARAGFNQQLLFLGGDDGPRGFPIAMAQLELVHDAVRASKYGDLGPYVVVLPGYDGVFYGYSPDQVAQWGARCRQLFVYCGIEHQPGRIPVGEGGSDYLPGGRMTFFDLILAEFDGPNDSAWRSTPTAPKNYPGNQIWQIGARMLGPAYRRPADQPADSDGATPPFYLQPQSPRGSFVHCAFEWVGEYLFVRDRETAEQVAVDRRYFQSAGWSCGG